MSRKAFADKSSWRVPSLFFFAGGYGPSHPGQMSPIEHVVVLLYDGNDCSPHQGHHKMYDLAGEAQAFLLSDESDADEGNVDASMRQGILVVDIRDIFETKDEMLIVLSFKETSH
jgi:hypothetical protein